MSGRDHRFDVAGTGSMVVDRILRTPRIVGPDAKIELASQAGGVVMVERVGGVLLNQLGWARVLGLRVAIFGKQADDREGRLLRAGMDRLGIARVIDLSGSASSVAQVLVDDAGERSIYMARGATGELTPEDIDARFADVIGAAAFVSSEVSQVPLASVRRVFERARAAGARTVLDLDLPRSEAVPRLGSEKDLDEILAQSDVLKASRSALAGWLDASDPAAAVRALRERFGVGLVVLTLGSEGAVVAGQGGTLTIPAASDVDVRDSTGAGDAFLGGLVAGLRMGLETGEAARLAIACGAVCCEQVGAFPERPEACRERILAIFEALGGAALRLPPLDDASDRGVHPATRRFLEVAPKEVEGAASGVALEALRAAADLVQTAERDGGRVHVTGIGKPAHVARYAAALLASTGTPATVLDATECTHGSAGQLCPGDVLIAISNSGTTRELLAATRTAAALGARLVAVTADPESALAREAEVALRARVADEGGPLGLAPRASVLAEMLVLQALSVELQARRDFSASDYHRRHPGGALGKKTS